LGRDVGTVEPGVVALSMFYALNAAQVLNFAIRMLAETEARMTSAERIHEYAVKVVPEAPALTDQPLSRLAFCGPNRIQEREHALQASTSVCAQKHLVVH
jgi:N-acyl-D-aspartate/D-glutamate deacylase